jgi:CBS domain containing-hemolysin-like protein
MRVLSIHFLLAVDNFDKIVGLISSEDILGTKPLQIIQDKPLTRENVKVHSIMIPCDKIVTINKDELKIAKVGHIIETLRQARQHYAFVVEVDPSNQKQTIVGLFSLSHISKQINKNLTDNNFIALSIAELHNKL